jgi:glycosyltransferase involved in cell wall biosynthesis
MRIVIWTGPAWETWGPGSLDTGIGGSELAAIHVAQGLARLGHEVEIVGQVHPGTWRGVTFTDSWTHVPKISRPPTPIECDVFVSSRSLTALAGIKPHCRLSALWMHDIHVGPDPGGLMDGYDIILNPSAWAGETASRHYPRVPIDRFVVTRNGIDPSLYAGPVGKTGCRAVYSSSPDRGLDKLLDYWPAIRGMRPDAELHVYYGFDTWERMAEFNHDRIARLTIDIFRTRLARMEGQGVVTHGRVGQAELARAWMGASLWLYPTSFCETSCITAMEAQAAGAWPITSDLAALRETLRHGVRIIPPNTRDGYREEFLGHVRSSLEGDDHGRADSLGIVREWMLRNRGWDGVARQWEGLFTDRMRRT